MKLSSKNLRIICRREGLNTVELDDGRIFDADNCHLRTAIGTVIASPVTCDLFSLPSTVDLRPLPRAQLFTVEQAAKKMRRSISDVATASLRIGKKVDGRRLMTADDISRRCGRGIATRTARGPRRGAVKGERPTTLTLERNASENLPAPVR